MLIMILMPLVMLMLVRASGDDDPFNFLLDPGRMSAFLFPAAAGLIKVHQLTIVSLQQAKLAG